MAELDFPKVITLLEKTMCLGLAVAAEGAVVSLRLFSICQKGIS